MSNIKSNKTPLIKLFLYLAVLAVLVVVNILLWVMVSSSGQDIQARVSSIEEKEAESMPSAGFVRNGLESIKPFFYKETEVLPLISALDLKSQDYGIELSMGGVSVDKSNPYVYKANVALSAQGSLTSLEKLLEFIKTENKLNVIDSVNINNIAGYNKQEGELYNMYLNLTLFILN